MVQEQLPQTSRRELFNELLQTFADHVYFQAPTNINMQYPCIVYSLDDSETLFADNLPYRYTKRYQVMVIDPDPDSPIPDQIASLPMSQFDRHYPADNLHHFVFSVYF